MAAEHFATFKRRDERKLTVRKESVVAFERTVDNEATNIYLAGREEPLKVEETPGQVGRAIGAA